MQQKKTNPIIQWWMTPQLPQIHIYSEIDFIKKWLLHPIKRRLARWYLKFLQKFTNIKVIGITGSAGKTTTKEMLASIFKQDGKTVFTKENIDPVYNIPSTILKTPIGTRYLILEMGVEYPGEMDFYLWLARPDIGIITNIFPTHLEFFIDINGVLKEKSKLTLNLDKNGVAILNSDDHLLSKLATSVKARKVWFKSGNDPLDANARAAEATAQSLGISAALISEGLEKYQRPKHRLTIIKLKNGANILDDSYNSNPNALLSTLKYFVKIAGSNNKIAVLGDMKELGEYEEKLHREIGKEIKKLGFKVVIGVGGPIKYLISEVGKNTKTYIVKNSDGVLTILKPYLKKGTYILVKGSRSIGLDKLVDALV